MASRLKKILTKYVNTSTIATADKTAITISKGIRSPANPLTGPRNEKSIFIWYMVINAGGATPNK